MPRAVFYTVFWPMSTISPSHRILSEKDYASAVGLMEHTGVVCNSYAQYQKWGSIASPLYTVTSWILNWAFSLGAFFLIGGHALACTIFASALIWAFGVRTFNYEGHGKGKDKRQEGIDFDRRNMSINQYWPGIVGGMAQQPPPVPAQRAFRVF